MAIVTKIVTRPMRILSLVFVVCVFAERVEPTRLATIGFVREFWVCLRVLDLMASFNFGFFVFVLAE